MLRKYKNITHRSKRILYMVLDVEGFEPHVLRGMKLENKKSQKRWPLFQYELGVTWSKFDLRHGNDTWSQESSGRYFESQGYDLFLIGMLMVVKWLGKTYHLCSL